MYALVCLRVSMRWHGWTMQYSCSRLHGFASYYKIVWRLGRSLFKKDRKDKYMFHILLKCLAYVTFTHSKRTIQSAWSGWQQRHHESYALPHITLMLPYISSWRASNVESVSMSWRLHASHSVCSNCMDKCPDSKVHGANMAHLGPTGPRWAPC